MAEDSGKRNIGAIYKFFGKGGPNPTLAGFQAEWAALTEDDKDQLSTGITDGSLNY